MFNVLFAKQKLLNYQPKKTGKKLPIVKDIMIIRELLKDLTKKLESEIGLRPVLSKHLSFDDYLLTQIGALMIEQNLVDPDSFSSVEYYSNQFVKGSDRPYIFDLSWNHGEGLLIISSVATDAEQNKSISKMTTRNKIDHLVKDTIELLTRTNASEAHYVVIVYPSYDIDTLDIYNQVKISLEKQTMNPHLDLDVTTHDFVFFSRTPIADGRIPATLFHISYKAPGKKSLIKNELVSSLATKWVKSFPGQNETVVDATVLDERKSQGTQQVSTETLPTKTVKIQKNTYRECLREIRDELLESNKTITVSELADWFELKVVERYRQQCERESKSITESQKKAWMEYQEKEMLRAFYSGSGGARYVQIHLYCVNSHLRRYYRNNLLALPIKDSKYDFNFFAFPYPEEDERHKFKDKRIKAYSLDDPELQDIQVLSISKGEEDYTKDRVVDLRAKHFGVNISSNNPNQGAVSKRGRKPQKGTSPVAKEKQSLSTSTKGKKKSVKEDTNLTEQPSPSMDTLRNYNTINLIDKIWLSVASLHYDNPTAKFFKNRDIIKRIAMLFYQGDEKQVDAGAPVLISSHLVAENPKLGVWRKYLTSEGRAQRRLYKSGDPTHPDREAGETHPDLNDIVAEFQYLLEWYQKWSTQK